MQMLGTVGAIAGDGVSMQHWGCPECVSGMLCGVGAVDPSITKPGVPLILVGLTI